LLSRRNIGRGFWGCWVLSSVGGGIIGIFGLGEGVQTFATDTQASLPLLKLGLAAGAVSGVLLTVITSIALRHVVPHIWWCLGIFFIVIAGWTSAGAVSQVVTIGEMTISNALIATAKGIWLGGCIGAMQWLVLRRKVASAGWWVLTSAAAWAILLTVGFPVMSTGLIGHITTGMEITGPDTSSISGRDISYLSQAGFALFIGIVFGTQLGLMQWLILRRNTDVSRWWPIVSAIGWALAWSIAGLIFRTLPAEVRFEYYGGILLSGLFVGLSGVAIGFPLTWLLRQPAVSKEVPFLTSTAVWSAGVGIVVAVAALALGLGITAMM
jgi:hypothetical protein